MIFWVKITFNTGGINLGVNWCTLPLPHVATLTFILHSLVYTHVHVYFQFPVVFKTEVRVGEEEEEGGVEGEGADGEAGPMMMMMNLRRVGFNKYTCMYMTTLYQIGGRSFGRSGWGRADDLEEGGEGRERRGGRGWSSQQSDGDDSFTMSVASSDVGRIIGMTLHYIQ